jgi:hypothetical protein
LVSRCGCSRVRCWVGTNSPSPLNPKPITVVAVVALRVMARAVRVVGPPVGVRAGKKKAGVNDAAAD